uniref:Uncharacterized protein n=1 Tax=Molossus molossus TaxID=27622 RepID=A0A7J8IZQ0_MOLMO|nr:hypothetical protein HJG59_010420 [Molossus molossus]
MTSQRQAPSPRAPVLLTTLLEVSMCRIVPSLWDFAHSVLFSELSFEILSIWEVPTLQCRALFWPTGHIQLSLRCAALQPVCPRPLCDTAWAVSLLAGRGHADTAFPRLRAGVGDSPRNRLRPLSCFCHLEPGARH